MTSSEALLLIAFVGLCVVPGVVSGALLQKKARGFELKIVILHSLAIVAPPMFFFVWHLFDRPETRGFWEISNFGSALGMAVAYGGPAAAIIGVASLISIFVSRAVFKRACAQSK